MMKGKRAQATYFFTLLCLFLLGAVPARAHGVRADDIIGKVGFDQRLNEQVPLDLVFRDETGKPVRLGDYFGKKPVILLLAYYNCPMLCGEALNGLVRSLQDLSFKVGNEFNVVTVSFNPNETPQIAAAKKKIYILRYARPGAADGWHFLTGKQDSIEKLTRAVGFRYAYDSDLNQYAHATGIVVLTPHGRIARYFYGIEYLPRDLRFSLIEASENKIGSPIDHILIRCYHYDPATGKYGVVIMRVVRLGGLATIVVLGTFMFVMLRRDRNKKSVNVKPRVDAGGRE
ncbi:MAG: SCO family protein [Ignavibacteriales bacterium]